MLSMQNDNEIGSVNSEYAQDFAFTKNCYLTAAGWFCDNIMYSYYTCYDKDVADSYMINNSELCYGCFEADRCYGCYGCKYSSQIFDCRDCVLSYDLKNCSDCTMCVGLRNKHYCILNQEYPREEYMKKVKEMDLENRESVERYKEELRAMALKYPRRYTFMLQSVDSTGYMVLNSKMSRDVFWVTNTENSRYLLNIDKAKDCYDCINTGEPNLSYDCVTPDQSYLDLFDVFCWRCNTVSYSDNCHSSNNLFGCVALRKSEYAILNKKYSKEDYLVLREKIIEHMKKTGEWGEFFPKSLSPYAYNETQAQEWFPLTKDEALKRGYRWREPDEKSYQITMKSDSIPSNFSEINDSILDEVISCDHAGTCNEKCSTAFRIVPQELQLYRKLKIPLPKLCPNCRHYQRIAYRNPVKLWKRQCQCAGPKSENGIYPNTVKHFHGEGKCPNEFETSYAPDRKEIVYCESCYNAEVV